MKETRERLEKILEQDKEDMNEATKYSAIKDFSRVAGEYFDRDGEPSLSVVHAKGGYSVSFTFRATRVKNFTTLK